MAGKPLIPYEKIVQAFSELKSAQEVASRFGISDQTVHNALKRHGLNARLPRGGISDQEIMRNYRVLGNGHDVAAKLGVRTGRVYDLLKANGIASGLTRGLKRRAVTPDQEILIVAAYKAGKSVAALSQEYGCSKSAIEDALKRNATKFRGRRLPLDKEEVKRLYESGMSYTQVAHHYGCGYNAIMRLIKREFSEIMRPKTGPQGPRWRGGRYVHRGYVYIWISDDDPFICMAEKKRRGSGPNAKGVSYVLEHRYVMAKKIGRPLLPHPIETVHHLDGNTENNAESNLQLRRGQHGKNTVQKCHACGSSNIAHAIDRGQNKVVLCCFDCGSEDVGHQPI